MVDCRPDLGFRGNSPLVSLGPRNPRLVLKSWYRWVPQGSSAGILTKVFSPPRPRFWVHNVFSPPRPADFRYTTFFRLPAPPILGTQRSARFRMVPQGSAGFRRAPQGSAGSRKIFIFEYSPLFLLCFAGFQFCFENRNFPAGPLQFVNVPALPPRVPKIEKSRFRKMLIFEYPPLCLLCFAGFQFCFEN